VFVLSEICIIKLQRLLTHGNILEAEAAIEPGFEPSGLS